MALKYKQHQINVCFIDALMIENNLKINRFSSTKYVNDLLLNEQTDAFVKDSTFSEKVPQLV